MSPTRPRALAVRLGIVAVVVALSGAAVAALGSDAGRRSGDGASGPSPEVAVGSGGEGTGWTGPGALKAGKKPAAARPSTATPTRWTGPQGRTGQFVVGCRYTHSGAHDPIVHPGHEGRSHRHDFYGSEVTDSESDVRDLLDADTTCNKKVDTAAYWHPTVYDRGEVVVPTEVQAYYRAAPGIDPTTVVTMPVGLAMIAGDQTATEPQAGEATGWTCGSTSAISDDPPDCPPSAPLHLVLTFQDCWDGEYLDSVDHQSHVTYSTDGACPSTHPVSIPQITTSYKFPISGEGHELTLASGNIYSAHGDFWNAWDPAGLEREVRACINRGSVCDLASNREEEALFSYES